MNNDTGRVTAWGAWIDYLRLTLPASEVDQVVRERYHQAVMAAGRASGSAATRLRPWAVLGYYGVQIGAAAWGESAQGVMVQASGAAASNLFGANLPCAGVPRLDLQVTVWYSDYDGDIAARAAVEAERARDARARRACRMRYIDGYGAGDTLYVGRRGKNARFLRLYDKWRETGESDEYLHAWRWEVELTDEHARVAYRELQSVGEADVTVASMVVSEFARRGITVPVPSAGLVLPIPRRIRRARDTDRRMAWLRSQVAPSLEKLLADGVERVDIMSALGLT